MNFNLKTDIWWHQFYYFAENQLSFFLCCLVCQIIGPNLSDLFLCPWHSCKGKQTV